MEKVKNTAIQVGMLFVIGKDHDIRMEALVNCILVLLHIVGCIVEFQCLVPIESIGQDLYVSSVVIGEVFIGCYAVIRHAGPSCDVVSELPYESLPKWT
jgi:hypothetical protein